MCTPGSVEDAMEEMHTVMKVRMPGLNIGIVLRNLDGPQVANFNKEDLIFFI
jgi:hypothetical protein